MSRLVAPKNQISFFNLSVEVDEPSETAAVTIPAVAPVLEETSNAVQTDVAVPMVVVEDWPVVEQEVPVGVEGSEPELVRDRGTDLLHAGRPGEVESPQPEVRADVDGSDPVVHRLGGGHGGTDCLELADDAGVAHPEDLQSDLVAEPGAIEPADGGGLDVGEGLDGAVGEQDAEVNPLSLPPVTFIDDFSGMFMSEEEYSAGEVEVEPVEVVPEAEDAPGEAWDSGWTYETCLASGTHETEVSAEGVCSFCHVKAVDVAPLAAQVAALWESDAEAALAMEGEIAAAAPLRFSGGTLELDFETFEAGPAQHDSDEGVPGDLIYANMDGQEHVSVSEMCRHPADLPVRHGAEDSARWFRIPDAVRHPARPSAAPGSRGLPHAPLRPLWQGLVPLLYAPSRRTSGQCVFHVKESVAALATFRRKNEGLSRVFSLLAGPPFIWPIQVAMPADQVKRFATGYG